MIKQWLNLSKILEITSKTVNEIEIGCCDHINAFGVYYPAQKKILIGAIQNTAEWRSILTSFRLDIITLGFLFILLHEIGHALVGLSEEEANEFTIRIVENMYNRKLNWPKEHTFTNWLKLIKQEGLIQ